MLTVPSREPLPGILYEPFAVGLLVAHKPGEPGADVPEEGHVEEEGEAPVEGANA